MLYNDSYNVSYSGSGAMRLAADPGIASQIPARPHNFLGD